MAEPLTSAIMAAVAKGTTDLVFRAIGMIAQQLSTNLSNSAAIKKTDLENHFTNTFERCSKIKTLLNRAEPVELLTIYVNTKFKWGETKFIDDLELIERLSSIKRVVVSRNGRWRQNNVHEISVAGIIHSISE